MRIRTFVRLWLTYFAIGILGSLGACTSADLSAESAAAASTESSIEPSIEQEDSLDSRMESFATSVTLESEQDIGLMARFHFATHTKVFDKAREFYRMLGYTDGRGGFPLTNTHPMARALGMFDECQYELA